MSRQISARKKLVVTIALALGLSLVPVSVNSSAVVQANNACANNKCCMEYGSWCGDLMGYYESIDRCDYIPGGGFDS